LIHVLAVKSHGSRLPAHAAENPLDLCHEYKELSDASALVVKETPYQVEDHADYLIAVATNPVVFLIPGIFNTVISRTWQDARERYH
jgi:hypothetical protein